MSRGVREVRVEHACGVADEARGGRLAEGLCLAATPTFALMALVACMTGGGMPATHVALASPTSVFAGMTGMYTLMSIFHAGPWLRRLAQLASPSGELAKSDHPPSRRFRTTAK